MKKAVTTISGGMDSTVLLHHIAKDLGYDEVHAISYDYGQRHACELEFAKYQASLLPNVHHRVVDISFFKDIIKSSSLTNDEIEVAKTKDSQGHPQTVNYVPFRNLMLLSIACAFAESINAETVFYGAVQLDTIAGFWDGSYEFLTEMNKLTALNRKLRVNVQAPLIEKSKKEIIYMGVKLGVDFQFTHTCYDPVNRYQKTGDKFSIPIRSTSCGVCTACGGRIKGFLDAGYIDPLEYVTHIPWLQYNCISIN